QDLLSSIHPVVAPKVKEIATGTVQPKKTVDSSGKAQIVADTSLETGDVTETADVSENLTISDTTGEPVEEVPAHTAQATATQGTVARATVTQTPVQGFNPMLTPVPQENKPSQVTDTDTTA